MFKYIGKKITGISRREEDRRYAYEKEAYCAFLQSIPDIGFEELYYLDFVIDLLRKEITYSASLEEKPGKRCCGTDYRLLLLQQLCKKKHLLETAAV